MQIMRNKEIVCCLWLSVLCCLLSCSEWNTDTFGTLFEPANSQVRAFTHYVTVEYTADGVIVGGAEAEHMKFSIDGLNVTIDNNHTDSLALLVYGYPASLDTLAQTDASLTVRSYCPYALYLNGLSLRSQNDVVVQSPDSVKLYLVVSNSSRNTLYGGLKAAGDVVLSGTGSLNIQSQGNCVEAASLQCQYGLNMTLRSQQGAGIHLTHGAMKATAGTWTIDAEQDAIQTPDSILLYAGTYQGSSHAGAYLAAPTFTRGPKLLIASAADNQILDSAYVAQRYDSVQSVWCERLDTLTLQADSLYEVFRPRANNAVFKFTPRQTIHSPFLLINQGNILPTDTLYFVHRPTNKKK